MMIRNIAVGIYSLAYMPALIFLAAVSIWNRNIPFAAIMLGMLAAFILVLYRVVTKRYLPRRIFGIIAACLGLLWFSLAVRRMLFVIREGGMERADGYGSPMAFALGTTMEFVLLAVPALGLVLIALFHNNQKMPNKSSVPAVRGRTFLTGIIHWAAHRRSAHC